MAEREAISAVLQTLIGEVKGNTAVIQINRTILEKLDQMLGAHDERVERAMPGMAKAVEEITKQLPGQKDKSQPRRIQKP
jgi:hypothetical protein